MKIEKEKCLIVRSQLSIPLHFISIVCLLPTVRAWQISHVCSSWYSTFFQREVEKSTHTHTHKSSFLRLHFGTKNKGSRPNAISELIFWFASFHSAVPVRIRNEILVCLCEVIDTSGWFKKKMDEPNCGIHFFFWWRFHSCQLHPFFVGLRFAAGDRGSNVNECLHVHMRNRQSDLAVGWWNILPPVWEFDASIM